MSVVGRQQGLVEILNSSSCILSSRVFSLDMERASLPPGPASVNGMPDLRPSRIAELDKYVVDAGVLDQAA